MSRDSSAIGPLSLFVEEGEAIGSTTLKSIGSVCTKDPSLPRVRVGPFFAKIRGDGALVGGSGQLMREEREESIK